MAIPLPALVLTSDSGDQFSPKLDCGVYTLEGMAEELELADSAFRETSDDNSPHKHPHPHLSDRLDPNEDRRCWRRRRQTRRESYMHAPGLSLHSDGGVLAAETLTDASPSPGPPPAPPEYDLPGTLPRRPATSLPSDPATEINPRENALAAPLIPIAFEYEDGLIPAEEVVGFITTSSPVADSTATNPPERSESGTDQRRREPDYGQTPTTSVVEPWPPLSPPTPPDQRPSATSMVLPGEEVIFQGEIKVGECKDDGVLYMWRNHLSKELRIQWHTATGRETLWMRASGAQIIPLYAQMHTSSLPLQLRHANGTQTPVFQFPTPDDLFRLQASLTGERVVLDVSCAKWLRVSRPNGSSAAETYSGIRVQIWHEIRKSTLPRRASSESRLSTGSTDGLSGPRRDRMVPQQSRLVVYLGALGGFLTVPITDDVELEDKGEMHVKLKARRYGGLRRRGSQPGIRARLLPPGAQAGLPSHDATVEKSEKYECYKSFDIEFETKDSKAEFVSMWDEVVEFRRKERARIERIQEEMAKQTFTGKQAIRQWF